MTPIKQFMLGAPDGHLADSIKWTIHEWDDSEPPTALQVLKTLDYCAYMGGASGIGMKALNLLLEKRLKAESTTYDTLCATASTLWRNAAPFTD